MKSFQARMNSLQTRMNSFQLGINSFQPIFCYLFKYWTFWKYFLAQNSGMPSRVQMWKKISPIPSSYGVKRLEQIYSKLELFHSNLPSVQNKFLLVWNEFILAWNDFILTSHSPTNHILMPNGIRKQILQINANCKCRLL